MRCSEIFHFYAYIKNKKTIFEKDKQLGEQYDNNGWDYSQKAICFYELGQYTRSINYWKLCISRNIEDIEYYFRLLYLYVHLGKQHEYDLWLEKMRKYVNFSH